MADSHGPRRHYAEVGTRHTEELKALQATIRRVISGRIVSFVAGLLAAIFVFDLPIPFAVTWGFVLVCLVIFGFFVAKHRTLKPLAERAEAGRAVAEEGVARVERDWKVLQELQAAAGLEIEELSERRAPDGDHAYSEDLDLYGPVSIRALLGPTPSPTGTRTLRQWLETPASPAELTPRQKAVRTLAEDFGLRHRLYLESRLVKPVRADTWGRFLEWLESPRLWEEGGVLPPWAPHVARILPVVTLTLGLAAGVGLPVHNLFWGVPLAIQAFLAWRWGGPVTGYFVRLGLGAQGLRRFSRLLEAWEAVEVDDPWIAERVARLRGDSGMRASSEIRVLEKALDMAESRISQLYPIFAVGLLWDIHATRRLEMWRSRAGTHVEDWFEVLGELEAASALAALAFDNPDWGWPEVTPDQAGQADFKAVGLGHPLLRGDVGRTNDVELEPPGRFLLVTGSNMSGKSTLLRSIGLAAVLAQAGAPVCAKSCRMTPMATFTSMRLADSIASGVSLFMAELQRLKALVDAAPLQGSEAPALLYLVDEVLQGTNSEERRIAAQRIITYLLDRRAVGAVTTHDLALHEEPRLDAASTKVHFRETVGGEGQPALSFDYVLREGLATSRNALKLLEVVGLGEDAVRGPVSSD